MKNPQTASAATLLFATFAVQLLASYLAAHMPAPTDLPWWPLICVTGLLIYTAAFGLGTALYVRLMHAVVIWGPRNGGAALAILATISYGLIGIGTLFSPESVSFLTRAANGIVG